MPDLRKILQFLQIHWCIYVANVVSAVMTFDDVVVVVAVVVATARFFVTFTTFAVC